MPRCSYCKKMYSVPRGLTLVLSDGTIRYLCSSKCRKNMAMKRRKVKWVSKAKKSKAEARAEAMQQAKEKERKAKEKKEREEKAAKEAKKSASE